MLLLTNCKTVHTKFEGKFGLNGPLCFYTSITLTKHGHIYEINQNARRDTEFK